MKAKRVLELVLVLVAVAVLTALWPKGRSSNEGTSEAREPVMTINGVGLGDSLQSIKERFGGSLTPDQIGKKTGDYTFGSEQGKLGYADMTSVKFDEQARALKISGFRLEQDGKRLADDYWAQDEKGKLETWHRLDQALGELPLAKSPWSKEVHYSNSKLILMKEKTGAWQFRLQRKAN